MALTPREHARRIVDRLARDRLILRLLDGGYSVEDAARVVRVDAALVAFVETQRPQLDDRQPSAEEVAARYRLGEISHAEMMSDLSSRTYTKGHIPDGAYDVKVRGTWDDVTSAHLTGLLSDADFETLLPLAPQ